jgi:hypothetical protein
VAFGWFTLTEYAVLRDVLRCDGVFNGVGFRDIVVKDDANGLNILTGVAEWNGPDFGCKPYMKMLPACVFWVISCTSFEVSLQSVVLGVVCKQVHGRATVVFDGEG